MLLVQPGLRSFLCAAKSKMKMVLSKGRSEVIASSEEFYLKRWLLSDYEQLKVLTLGLFKAVPGSCKSLAKK